MRLRDSHDQGRDLSIPPKLERTLKMAIALEHRPVRRAAGAQETGSLTHHVQSVFARIASAWQRYRVQRELEGLSYDQRKDIGFRAWDKTTR